MTDTIKKIYEGWAEDLTLAAPWWYSHEEANGWNNGFTSGYTAALEERLEDVASQYATFLFTYEDENTHKTFEYFLNNIYNGK